jgi:hypothetical protein
MAVSIVHYTEVSGVIALGVRRTIGPVSRSKFCPKAALYSRFISAAAVICRMNALDGFGFTRALIFPYDELDFLPLRSPGGNAHA